MMKRQTQAEYEESVIEAWKRAYIDGRWTLEELERHLEQMLPLIIGIRP